MESGIVWIYRCEMRTYIPSGKLPESKWYLIDAKGLVLGRMSTFIATILRGKNKPGFTPFLDVGDFVIVVNASKVRLTGKKLENKKYYRHTGYPGGLKTVSAQDLMEKKPEKLILYAVQGMLPKTKLGRAQLKKLKVYGGENHPHQAQKPEPLSVPD
jgi:large subunit ribosomal protein L13